MSAAPPCQDNDRLVEYSLTKQHQCQIDYMAELSKAKGLEELWKTYQPEFQQVMSTRAFCSREFSKAI